MASDNILRDFARVTTHRPCPICGKPDWCLISRDNPATQAIYRQKADAANAAIDTLGGQLAGLRAKLVATDGSQAHRVVRAVQTILAGRTKLTNDEKCRVLRAIVRRIDVEVERLECRELRDATGHFQPGRFREWAIRNVSFRLECGAAAAPEARRGQLVTTYCGCDQVTVTVSCGERGSRSRVGDVANASACFFGLLSGCANS